MTDAGGALDDRAEIDAEAEPGDRATPLRIVGLLLGLLVIAGAAASLLVPRGAELVPEEVLGDLFASVDDGFAAGFEAVEARRLPAGETLVRFTGGEAPAALLFVRFPRERAERVLEDQFRSLRFDDGDGGGSGDRSRGGGPPGSDGGGGGSPKLQDVGTLDWHGLEARYARLRHTEEPDGDAGDDGEGEDGDDRAPAAGATYDTIRVNLTTAQQCLVAYARFAPGSEATPGAVEEALRRFRPLE